MAIAPTRQDSTPTEPARFVVDIDQARKFASEPVLERLRQIEAIDGYSRYFHRAVPNNFVFLLVKNDASLDDYLDSIARHTAPLNEANARVYRYCLEKLKQMPRALVDEALIQRMGSWERTISTSANLGGVVFAEQIFDLLKERGVDAQARWPTETPELREMFINVPRQVEGLLRINLCIPQNLVIDSLRELLGQIMEMSESRSLVDRIEVAKPHVASIASARNYPTLILYLTPDANESQRFRDVAQLLNQMQPFFRNFADGLDAEPDLADHWFPFVTITQGHRLWKRYLRVVGLLDEVYDRTLNHAYLKPKPEDAPKNFPRILTPFRATTLA